jgi:NADPH:quinone reductase
MKALVLDQPGSHKNLRLAEVVKPKPSADQVLIKVHAVGLNPVDYKFAQWGHSQWQYPFILGLDVAGTIEEIGANVTGWNIGDRVYYHGDLSKPGGYAEYTTIVGHSIAPIPENLTFIQAAALPCAGFTAYQALHSKLNVKAGQTILIHGGAGGVGGYAIQLASLAGLKIISTCSQTNFDWVRNLGADELIDYQHEDVFTRIQEITKGRGVDAIIDTISSESATLGLKMLAFGGGIVCVVALPDFSSMKSFGKALSVHDIALGGAYLRGDRQSQAELAAIGCKLAHLVSEGKVKSLLQEVIKLEQIPDGLERLYQRHVKGKIVAQIAE